MAQKTNGSQVLRQDLSLLKSTQRPPWISFLQNLPRLRNKGNKAVLTELAGSHSKCWDGAQLVLYVILELSEIYFYMKYEGSKG